MLRIIQNSSASGAKSYYSTADYYSEGQELVGHWRGDAATRLGLSGEVTKSAWDALCDNRDPTTGMSLTVRRKVERRVGYDFNFHVPKSVSLLYGLTGDERILSAFRDSVDATMRDMEAEMKTRVRQNGNNEDRTTGNMIWGEFVHTTARPVDGVPNPHLHAHCFVFNVTWDKSESRWKAGQFADLKRDAPYFEAKFHARMARRMEELGLQTERTRTGWELSDIPPAAIKRFSRRTALIEATAKELGLDGDAKDELGAKTRESKRKELSLAELRREWQSRLPSDERDALAFAAGKIGGPAIAERPDAGRDAADYAALHCFERAAVVPERKLMATALKRGIGSASPESIEGALSRRDLIWAERDGRRMVTTREVLAEERDMIAFARDGRGACPRLGSGTHVFARDWLNEQQRRAVKHVLESPDLVIIIRGAAGTGKTSMMHEAAEAIEARGTRVFVFAPSADASRGVLRSEGFDNAETVARLLVDQELQALVRGSVIWVDEAGLVGTRTMAELFSLADQLDARVILSGDRRQHGSIERGSALRLLETEAGLRPAEIRDIQRQKGNYKQAVQALSEGRTAEGFRELDRLGWIEEAAEGERYKALAADYVVTVTSGQSALVVSPTHVEGARINAEIRGKLKDAGLLGKDEREFRVLRNANMTQAERSDAFSYLPGDVLVFHQNGKGHTKGDRVIAGDGPLPLDQAARFQAYHPDSIRLAAGDMLKISRNGQTADGKHRLSNGGLYRVREFTDAGDIVLENGWVVSRDYGHFTHGYCVTSHVSQGKTVDVVLIGQSSRSFPASSREQFYVSVSRGKRRAVRRPSNRRANRLRRWRGERCSGSPISMPFNCSKWSLTSRKVTVK